MTRQYVARVVDNIGIKILHNQYYITLQLLYHFLFSFLFFEDT